MSEDGIITNPEREEAIRALHAKREELIQEYLRRVGIAQHELKAKWELVPDAVKKAIPETVKSFGLIGCYGVGKTFAIVAKVRRLAAQEVDDRVEDLLAPHPEVGGYFQAGIIRNFIERPRLYLWPLWVNWPQDIAAKRGELFKKNGHEPVEEWILKLQDPKRLLILDDLGADKATAQDWAGETLSRIIDERLRREGPTIWTSNLNAVEMAERYGARTFSRLHALAPGIKLPNLPDLRLKGIA